jgi:hypothetical protein
LGRQAIHFRAYSGGSFTSSAVAKDSVFHDLRRRLVQRGAVDYDVRTAPHKQLWARYRLFALVIILAVLMVLLCISAFLTLKS